MLQLPLSLWHRIKARLGDLDVMDGVPWERMGDMEIGGFFAEMKLADGALLEVEDWRNELTVGWPGMRMSLPTKVVHE